MSEQYGDQLIVHFLAKPKMQRFNSEDQPSHVTLLPWFYIAETREDELEDELRRIARQTEPISVKTEGEDMFGRRHNIRVRLLGAESLRAIHYRLTNVVENNLKGVIRETEFRGRKYRPHIAEQDHILVPANKELKVDSFSIVQKVDTPRADREIINTYKFEG